MNKTARDGDKTVLAALDGIVRMQRTARNGLRDGLAPCVDTGLVFIEVYYNNLPGNIARRLSELLPATVADIPRVMSFQSTDEERQAIALSVASDAAFAQAIRAANVYREKLGYPLLDPEGNPKLEESGEVWVDGNS